MMDSFCWPRRGCRGIFRFSQTVEHSSSAESTGGRGLFEAQTKAAKEHDELCRAIKIATDAGISSVEESSQNIERSQRRRKPQGLDNLDETVSPLINDKGIEMRIPPERKQVEARPKNDLILFQDCHEESKIGNIPPPPPLPESHDPVIRTLYQDHEFKTTEPISTASTILFGGKKPAASPRSMY